MSIPAVRDRVVQAAVKIVLEPVFEADFLPCSFGFRPKRAAHDGGQVLVNESFAGARWWRETDVADCPRSRNASVTVACCRCCARSCARE